ncbi:MAG: hypothetical protein J5507_03805 [Clostridia bacterium]|nr:hypothetical protein [Clostridia bacterium]
MYERNAIIIERYFNSMFGYDIKNNLKSNFYNYCELIKVLENYKNSTEEEEEVIIDYDIIANKIRDIQKKQENLNKRNFQLQEERNNIFQSLDEDANLIQKKWDTIYNNLKKIDEEIQENVLNFINVIEEFNEKSIVRNKCGKNRRVVEIDYNKKLNDTLDNYKNIDENLEKKAKNFIELDTTELKNELKNAIKKNGEKEKIPFQEDVIEQAIIISIDAQKKETEILSNIYEKTNKLFAEIKNNSLKIDKHKKLILDSTSKINFISAIKEYVVQFLDNERLAAVNGEKEYNKLMKDACNNLNDDLKQINNLYTLLLKEISKKANKKAYIDLYKIEYLQKLENKAEEFENQVKKLKLPVAVINPDYWRIEGMKRIYEIFNKCVTEYYNRDLKEFVSADEDSDENSKNYIEEKESLKIVENDIDKHKNNLKAEFDEEIENQNDSDLKSEIDRKIDIILGLKNNDEKNTNKENEQDDEDWDIEDNMDEDDWEDEDLEEKKEDNDDWEDEELEDEIEEDDDDYDDWEDEELEDEIEEDDDEWEDNYDWEEEELENNQKDYDIFEKNDKLEDDESEYLEEDGDGDEDVDYDIWGNNITKKQKKSRDKKNKIQENDDKDWGNEFINFDEKDKNKKKGFFEKFKK